MTSTFWLLAHAEMQNKFLFGTDRKEGVWHDQHPWDMTHRNNNEYYVTPAAKQVAGSFNNTNISTLGVPLSLTCLEDDTGKRGPRLLRSHIITGQA